MRIGPSLAIFVLALALGSTELRAESLFFKGADPMSPPMKDRLASKQRFAFSGTLYAMPFGSVVDKCKTWTSSKRWSNDQTLKVCFVDKYTKPEWNEWKAAFVKVAKGWTKHHPKLFDFGEPGFHVCGSKNEEPVRVAFSTTWEGKKSANWGCVGMDSINPFNKECGRSVASLNINPESVKSPSSLEFRHAVLHEFGHALAFDHEHQNKFVNCWDNEIDKTEAQHRYGMSQPELRKIFGALDLPCFFGPVLT